MTLSTELTWQFDVNQFLTAANLTELARMTLLELKNSLVGFASNPWIVAGSSDTFTAAMDGVDRWITTTNLTYTTSGTTAHPWIVLEQPAMGGLQLLISGPKNNNQIDTMYWSVSPSGSFSGGNATIGDYANNPPTAPDEQVIHNNATWGDFSAGTPTHYLSVMQSTNGACTRFFSYSTGTGVFGLLGMIETVKNPTPGWSHPYYFFNSKTASNIGYTSTITTNHSTFGAHNGSKYTLIPTYESYGAGSQVICHTRQYGALNTFTQSYDFYKIGLVSYDYGMRGTHGQLYDAWWGSGIGGAGGTSPSTVFNTKTHQSRNYIQIQELVLPWNGIDELSTV